jgi:hypothetical protein
MCDLTRCVCVCCDEMCMCVRVSVLTICACVVRVVLFHACTKYAYMRDTADLSMIILRITAILVIIEGHETAFNGF